MRAFRIEVHEFVEENMSHRGQPHRSPGMARICFEGGIDLERTVTESMRESKGAIVEPKARVAGGKRRLWVEDRRWMVWWG
jgi:hypothetical protein